MNPADHPGAPSSPRASDRTLPEALYQAFQDLIQWSSAKKDDEATSLGAAMASQWMFVLERCEKRPKAIKQSEWETLGKHLLLCLPRHPSFKKLAEHHPETLGMVDRLYGALLKAGAWKDVASKDGQPKVGAGFLTHMENALTYSCPATLAWLLQAVTHDNVGTLFTHRPYRLVRVADGGFTSAKVSDWAVLLRQLPFEHLQELVRKGADPNADDGLGWSVCCHARGYDPDPVRAEWLIENGADPLNPGMAWEKRQKALVGVARGWGDLLTGEKLPVSPVVTDYVLDRLSQWSPEERHVALDQLKKSIRIPSVHRFLVSATLQSSLRTSSPGRGPRL